MIITRTAVLLACCCLFCASAWGQSGLSGGAGVGQKLRPGQEKLPATDIELPGPAPALVLPPVTPEQQSDRLSPQLRVFVRTFEFTGNRVFSDSELAEITSAYQGRIITSAELQQVRDKVSLLYLNSGYINSGAIIPDQKVDDNVIVLRIIEGELTRVELTGNDRLGERYLSERLRRGAGEPLNIVSLENELKILQQNPVIKRLNAELKPGDRLGESILFVQVEEDKPGRADISFNNHRPPSVGAEQVEIDATYYSLTGYDDPFTVYLGLTEGLSDLFLLYRRPLNARDTRLGLYFEYTDSEVVEEPFDDLDIESDAKTWGVRLTHPLQRSPAGYLSAGLALERRSSNTQLLDVPFSFAEGVDEGNADVTPLRLSVDWLRRDLNSVIAARSIVSIGLDALGATKNGGGVADGRFVAWLGQAQWVRRFGKRGYQAVVKASAQFTNDALLPLEKFVVGGHDTVRGYRENQMVRDKGYTASAELRIPLYRGDSVDAQWQIAPFVDYGKAWEENRDTLNLRDITGIGAVLRWQPTRRLRASITAAHAFENIDRVNRDRDLQDRGINLSLDYHLY